MSFQKLLQGQSVSTTYYDANVSLDAKKWLELDEHEQVRLVKNYLLGVKPKTPAIKIRALLLAQAEGQIARGFRPARQALTRLQGEGLTRASAIQLIAATIGANPLHIVSAVHELPTRDRQLRLNKALDGLSATIQTGTDSKA